MTLGKFHNAAYLAGGIRDQGNWFGGSDVSTKVGNTLAYSFASDAFTMQVDAIMNPAMDTGGAVDEVQFGLSVSLGDIGKVAIGYENREDAMTDLDMDGEKIGKAMPHGTMDINGKGNDIVWRRVVTSPDANNKVVMVKDVKLKSDYMMISLIRDDVNSDPNASIAKDDDGNYRTNVCADDGDVPTTCKAEKVIVSVAYTAVSGGSLTDEDSKPTAAYTVVSDYSMAYEATIVRTDYGHKRSGISAVFGLGGVDVRLGHSAKDSNDPMKTMKEKTNFLGVTGGIGDTGLSFLAYGRNKKGHDGKETSPWGVGLTKSLGDGVSTWIEHENADDGKDGNTIIALKVDF